MEQSQFAELKELLNQLNENIDGPNRNVNLISQCSRIN